MDLGLEQKKVLVAGSSRGIGRGIAEGFLREGAFVGISGRNKENLQRAAEELGRHWGPERILEIEGDLCSEEGIGQCVRRIREAWEGLDVLVANVGSGRGKTGSDVPIEEWERLVEHNLIGSARLASAAVPLIQRRGGGSVVFVASLAGVEALPAPLPYSAAKSGLIATSKNLSRLLAPDHIRVNVLAPGNILFPGGVWQHKLDEVPEQVTGYITAEVPLRRLGTVQEVADAVLFLASERASFITGVCLLVDGGQARGW